MSMKWKTQRTKKFFLVTNEFAENRRIEQMMAEYQDKNCNITDKVFRTKESNFLILGDCRQSLYTNQQLNLFLAPSLYFLNLVHADVKSYKAALNCFKDNLLSSVPTLLDQRLTISLLPCE